MNKPTCGTCVYWEDEDPKDPDIKEGFCRKKAPRRIRVHKSGNMESTTYILNDTPKTLISEFCGEHHLFETWLKTVTGQYEAERKKG